MTKAIIHTSMGDINVDLYKEEAPETVENFVGLATGTKEWTDPATGKPGEGPLYDGTVFHRIIPNFMIQGGDPLGTGTGGPGYMFDDEISPRVSFSVPYLLAMANAGTRRVRGKVKGTNGSQFFITVIPTDWLNGKHTIFGMVSDPESKRVVDNISVVPTGFGDRPSTPVIIENIEIIE